MTADKIETLLKVKMGLDVRSIGDAAVERAIRERVTACGLRNSDEYWDCLCGSETEVQALIEAIVVPETWFFRDREAFTALTGIALEEWLRVHPVGALRLLSLPCSTGEEPYSIAMALLDAGLPPARFQVDAVDISARAISHAEGAEYGKNSFRGTDLAFRERHFERTARGVRLSAAVRQQVRFRQDNLFDAGAFLGTPEYDVIFCRNVLIYFDREDQERTVGLLSRLLAPRGMLFVGSSESALFLDHGFVSVRSPLAFAFRKPGANVTRTPQPLTHTQGAKSAKAPAPVSLPPASRRRPFTAATQSRPLPKPASEDWIATAQRLADEGKLTEALEICERGAQTAPSAQAFYLTGLIHDAAGRLQQASENYRKALYLDPLHEEALVHLGAALMRDGDAQGAQRLFDRAERARRAGGEF